MQKVVVEKIKSARKLTQRSSVRAGLFLVACALLAFLPSVLYRPPTATLVADGKAYTLEIAATDEARELGLGGRTSIADDRGMLFVMDRPDRACFWMKDMKFAIDIIWLDAQKRVIQVEDAVSPATYPASFCPKQKATYVIELHAGEASKHDIREGAVLKI